MNYLIGHLVGDYILQNDWMAKNKKKHDLPCFVHCFLWTLSVMVFTGWVLLPNAYHTLFVGMLVFLSHYVFDRTNICMWYMTITKKSGSDNPFFPLVYVAVDNTCHLVLLFMIDKFLI